MIRFANGTPQAIWYSQHASGQAFTYNAVEKKGIRPYAYSGNGTHANYVIVGYLKSNSTNTPMYLQINTY